MTDDNGESTPRSEEREPQTQAGVVMAPPPQPPAPPTTGMAPHGEERPGRRGGLVGGVILILVGLILLAQQFFPGFGFERLWPLIIIVIGLAIIFRRRR